jgi:hypothetical protein
MNIPVKQKVRQLREDSPIGGSMCGTNCNTPFVKLIMKAITDAALRERFLANPMQTAQEFGFTEYDQNELARYDARKLRAMVEGPVSH